MGHAGWLIAQSNKAAEVSLNIARKAFSSTDRPDLNDPPDGSYAASVALRA